MLHYRQGVTSLIQWYHVLFSLENGDKRSLNIARFNMTSIQVSHQDFTGGGWRRLLGWSSSCLSPFPHFRQAGWIFHLHIRLVMLHKLYLQLKNHRTLWKHPPDASSHSLQSRPKWLDLFYQKKKKNQEKNNPHWLNIVTDAYNLKAILLLSLGTAKEIPQAILPCRTLIC